MITNGVIKQTAGGLHSWISAIDRNGQEIRIRKPNSKIDNKTGWLQRILIFLAKIFGRFNFKNGQKNKRSIYKQNY